MCVQYSELCKSYIFSALHNVVGAQTLTKKMDKKTDPA